MPLRSPGTVAARTDAEIVAAVEASAGLDLDASATIDGSGIVSDADLALVALDDLADVSVASPTDQDVLTWDDGTSTWVAQAAAGGGVSGDVATSIELTRTTATSTGANSIVIGNGASATLSAGIAIGQSALNTCYRGVAIGYLAKTELVFGSGADNVAIGRAAYCSNTSNVAIGIFGEATQQSAVSVGPSADALAQRAIAIGRNATADKTESIVIGGTASTTKPATRNSTRLSKLFHVVELRAAPSDGTPTEATSDGAAASTGDTAARNVVVLADGKVVGFTLAMTAIQATTNDAALYEIVGAAKCIAGTASIIGTNTTIAKEDDAGWDCTVTCTSNRLVVTCTADAGGASTWRGTLTLTYED